MCFSPLFSTMHLAPTYLSTHTLYQGKSPSPFFLIKAYSYTEPSLPNEYCYSLIKKIRLKQSYFNYFCLLSCFGFFNNAWSKQYSVVCKSQNTLIPPTIKVLFQEYNAGWNTLKKLNDISYTFESPCYLQSEFEIFSYIIWRRSFIFIWKEPFIRAL